MKKAILVLIAGLVWCNVGFAASKSDLIRKCAEYFYGVKLTDEKFEKIMSPSNLENNDEFIEQFVRCELMFKDNPITMKEIFD